MEKNNGFTGIGFSGLLTLIFIVLRLCKVISWSWWWVLSPIWISIAIIALAIIGVVVVSVWKDRREKNN